MIRCKRLVSKVWIVEEDISKWLSQAGDVTIVSMNSMLYPDPKKPNETIDETMVIVVILYD